ncbi:MAG: hypothetical protein WDZ94_03940 [Patescibacteria group bacterium]
MNEEPKFSKFDSLRDAMKSKAEMKASGLEAQEELREQIETGEYFQALRLQRGLSTTELANKIREVEKVEVDPYQITLLEGGGLQNRKLYSKLCKLLEKYFSTHNQ